MNFANNPTLGICGENTIVGTGLFVKVKTRVESKFQSKKFTYPCCRPTQTSTPSSGARELSSLLGLVKKSNF